MYLYMCFVPPPLLILAGKKYHTLWKDTTYTKPALLILIFFFPQPVSSKFWLLLPSRLERAAVLPNTDKQSRPSGYVQGQTQIILLHRVNFSS